MVKKVRYTYRGMNQDITKSKHSVEFYYEANNIRITSTDSQSAFSVTNEKGNERVVELPSVSISGNIISYGDNELVFTNEEITQQLNSGILAPIGGAHKIIGYSLTRNAVILFTTTDNVAGKRMDCIWKIDDLLEGDFDLSLLYVRAMNFSENNPIQTLFNYENDRIQKVYWADGNNQLRFLNIEHSIANEDNEELIDISLNTINIVGNFDLSQPKIISVGSGGNHTAGMIQYGYNLYRLNAAQTKISPLSELIPLDKGNALGGGDVEEVVGALPNIRISDIDQEYTHIKLYAVKYTSYNQLPKVSLIANAELSGTIFNHFDDGSTLEDITVEEFAFLGSDPVAPRHIESKDNTLFAANLQEIKFDVDLDMRAYGHRTNGTGIVYNNVQASPENPNIPIGDAYPFNSVNYPTIPLDIDAVNLDYDNMRYQSDGTTEGGEGIYLKYELTQAILTEAEAREFQFFKDDEIYRIGIEFYNSVGQTSFPKWIADFKAPKGNLNGRYNTLKVELKPDFYVWLADSSNFPEETDKPIGYRIIRADRTVSDRTIVAQGAMVQMMARTTDDPTNFDYWNEVTNRREESKELTKFPITISRGFDNTLNPIQGTSHLRKMNTSGAGAPSEIWEATPTGQKRGHSWQFTRMMQMYSPEAMFSTGINFTAGMKLQVKGMARNTRNDYWYKRIRFTTGQDVLSVKEENFDDFYDNVDTAYLGVFGPSDKADETDQMQVNREYHNWVESPNNVNRAIYGKPEITFRGQGTTSYNNDSELKYTNSMAQFVTDEGGDSDKNAAIVTMNSFGNDCITIVEGADTLELGQRARLEDLRNMTGISQTDGILVSEIRIPEINIYLGGIYGGNTVESKSRNTYIRIGDYKPIAQGTVTIDSPGDTFVDYYELARLTKTDTVNLDDQTLQHTDIMSFKVETTVDLKNRNDLSLFDWDAEFQPADEDYHKYNNVYSQQPTLLQNSAEDFTFRTVKNFDARVIASKVKVPGEAIDSWTDFLVNEQKDLDGKYGPINALVNFKDNIYTLQDQGVAMLSINPRVQVQGGDGVALELGTGGVLYDYNYISTNSGTINKWSVVPTERGFYYYDALNKSLIKFGEGLQSLSTAKGMQTFFDDAVNYDDILQDNPINSRGVVAGYNPNTDDVYLTVLQSDNSFTLAYNERSGSFVSFYDYKPSHYIMKGFRMLTPNPDNTELWEHFRGNSNTFYGTRYPFDITILANPQEPDCVFTNIEYKAEAYGNSFTPQDIEITDLRETFTHLTAWNEYQTTARTELVYNSNLSRKFRTWRANIPRGLRNGNPSLDRIRGHWCFLKLEYDNYRNRDMIFHDIDIGYTAYR